MRISDWSSDVCSSDLETRDEQNADAALEKERFRSPHATVLRQREPAQQAQHAKSVAPPGDVPDAVAEQSAADRADEAQQAQHPPALRHDGDDADRKSNRLNSSH